MPKNLYLRAGVYWARFKAGGQEYRQSLRTRSERVAVKRLAALREQVEDQVVYGIAGPIGWSEAVVSWGEHVAPALGERTFARYACSLRQLRNHLDTKSVQEVDAELLKEIVKARRRAGVKNATITRDLTALSSVLNHAADEGWIAENPAASLNRRRIAPERLARIVLPQDASIALVYARLPDRLRDVFELTREIGLRLDEVLSLRHTDLDRTAATVTVLQGKGNKTRVVSLTPAAATIIDQQPRFIGAPWVFWRDRGERLAKTSTAISSNVGAFVRRVAQQAARDGVEFHPFSHHGMRHLFAVEYLRKQRGSIYDLQRELGHSTIKVTERYLDFLTPQQANAAKSGVAHLTAHEQRSEAAEA